MEENNANLYIIQEHGEPITDVSLQWKVPVGLEWLFNSIFTLREVVEGNLLFTGGLDRKVVVADKDIIQTIKEDFIRGNSFVYYPIKIYGEWLKRAGFKVSGFIYSFEKEVNNELYIVITRQSNDTIYGHEIYYQICKQNSNEPVIDIYYVH